MNKYDYFTKLSAHPFYNMDFQETDRFNKENGIIFLSLKNL